MDRFQLLPVPELPTFVTNAVDRFVTHPLWFYVSMFIASAPIMLYLMEGGVLLLSAFWKTLYPRITKWLLVLLDYLYLYDDFYEHVILQKPIKLHQAQRNDIRIMVPTAITIDFTAWKPPRPPWTSPRRSSSPFGHHQYGIRIRLRSKYFTLRYGWRFRQLLHHGTTRDILKMLKRVADARRARLKTHPTVSTIDIDKIPKTPHSYFAALEYHFDSNLYNIEKFQRLCDIQRFTQASTCWDYEMLPAFERLHGKTFESYYGINKTEAWDWLENEAPDPLQWFRNYRDLNEPAFFDLQNQSIDSETKAIQAAVTLQRDKVPHVAMIARATLPNKQEMSCAYLSESK